MRRLAWSSFLFAMLLISVGLFLLNSRELEHSLNLMNSDIELEEYGDHINDGGNSKVLWQKKDKRGISFSHEIDTGFAYPYAGITLNFNSKADTLSCGKWGVFDTLKIKMSSQKSSGFMMHLTSQIPEENRINLKETERLVQQMFPSSSVIQTYALAIKDFRIPEWWKFNHNLPYLENRNFLNSGVCHLSIVNNHPHLDYRVVDTTQIFSITLTGRSETYPRLGTLGVVFGIVLLMLPAIRPKQFALVGRSRPKALELEDSEGKWVQLIKEGYESHYSEEGLTVEQMAKHLGTHVKKLQMSLKAHFGKTHKVYLNELRVEEAKRLLLESSEPIGVIALRVGYTTVTHFNRTFKELVHQTPGVFRKIKLDENENK